MVNSPLIRPAIYWGKRGIGGVPSIPMTLGIKRVTKHVAFCVFCLGEVPQTSSKWLRRAIQLWFDVPLNSWNWDTNSQKNIFGDTALKNSILHVPCFKFQGVYIYIYYIHQFIYIFGAIHMMSFGLIPDATQGDLLEVVIARLRPWFIGQPFWFMGTSWENTLGIPINVNSHVYVLGSKLPLFPYNRG